MSTETQQARQKEEKNGYYIKLPLLKQKGTSKLRQ